MVCIVEMKAEFDKLEKLFFRISFSNGLVVFEGFSKNMAASQYQRAAKV